MALGPVALGGIGNVSDAEDVKDFAQNGLTQRAADAAQGASATARLAGGRDGERDPASDRGASGETPAEVEARLTADYPEAAEFLAEWDTIGPRLSLLADSVSESVAGFESAEKLPIAFPLWILIAAGLLLAGSAGLALTRR